MGNVDVNSIRYRFYRELSRIAGVFLLTLGLVGDCLEGLLLLYAHAGSFILWHILFTLLWASGVNLLARQDRARRAVFYAFPNKWGLTALLLGMGTFPGLGICACALAFLLARYLFSSSRLSGAQDAHLEGQKEYGREEMLSLHDGIVSPFVDDLHEGNTEARRAVVARLSRSAQPAAARLLRQLLSDAKAEIRSDASIALTCLDDELSRVLHRAFADWQTDPADVEYTLAFVERCHRYALSNVLDTLSQRFYLALARDLLLEILGGGKREEAHLWLKLADIRQRLGELPEALQDALHAVQLQPDSHEASLLAMDLAFRSHAWDALLSLAQQHTGGLPGFSTFQSSQVAFACPVGSGSEL